METYSEKQRYITFSLAGEAFAVPLLQVREVIAMPEITPVPQTPPHFLGIMNLRGQIITIIDLRTKLGIKPATGSETAVIICDLNPVCLGVVVDSINSVLALSPTDISERPEMSGHKADYISGISKQNENLVLLLDIAKVLSVTDQNILNKSQMAKKAS